MIGDILGVLENFSFLTQWNPGVFYFAFLFIVLYLFLLPSSKEHTVAKTLIFISGILLFALALGSPLNLLARILFRAHILQMIILYLIVPPMIIIGMKTLIVSKVLSFSYIKKGYQLLTNSIVAIVLFHTLFISYHIPAVFDYVRISFSLNYIYLFIMFLTALCLWSPILSSLGKWNRLSKRKKYLYSLVNALLFFPLAIIFLLSKENLYSIYSDIDLLMSSLALCLPPGETIDSLPKELLNSINPFPPLKEQKIGGAILIVSQLVWLNVVLVKTDSKLS